MNRRSFVKATTSFATAFAGDFGLFVAPEPARAKIRIGFLGVSHSHAMGKVKAVQESPEFELIGVSEAAERHAEPYRQMGIKVLSPDQLLGACSVVAVESAVRDHARHAKLALLAGKHVHVEKPPADTLKEFQDLISLAQAKELLLQTGYMWRYNPGLVAAMQAAKERWLGQVYLIRATMNSHIPADRRPEWAEFKGGAMFELGSHLVDAVVRLMGRPKAVTPLLRKHGNFSDDLADNTVAILEFEKTTAIITSSALQPNANEHRFFEILGTNGTALLKPMEPPTLQIDLAKPAGPYAAKTQTITFPPYRRYVADLAELAQAARGNRALSVSLEQELLVQETLMRLCEG